MVNNGVRRRKAKEARKVPGSKGLPFTGANRAERRRGMRGRRLRAFGMPA